jgi:LysR family transcriptional regulator, transcriptional activator of the cysJI operon
VYGVERGANSLEFNELRMFEAIYKYGSFTEAAHQLYVSQPTASTTIKNLEQKIGSKLFQRYNGGLKLTEAGELLLRYSKRILPLVDESLKEIESLKAQV